MRIRLAIRRVAIGVKWRTSCSATGGSEGKAERWNWIYLTVKAEENRESVQVCTYVDFLIWHSSSI